MMSVHIRLLPKHSREFQENTVRKLSGRYSLFILHFRVSEMKYRYSDGINEVYIKK